MTITLSYFAYANPSFSRGRSIFTKTIFHAKSKRKGYNEWLHPDVVGVYLPLDDWKQEVIVFNQLLDNNSIRLFSFELKKSITKANYRESYFQAVSNSSWAHEGYLVAADITQDDDSLSELERLSVSFGIGVIHLRLRDFDSSMVLFPAHTRVTLDWETVNKLCDQNKDFEKFIQDVRIDFDSKRFHSSEYDPILKDPIKYIKDKTNNQYFITTHSNSFFDLEDVNIYHCRLVGRHTKCSLVTSHLQKSSILSVTRVNFLFLMLPLPRR